MILQSLQKQAGDYDGRRSKFCYSDFVIYMFLF